jgi:A/G-specific adenine glycosylase
VRPLRREPRSLPAARAPLELGPGVDAELLSWFENHRRDLPWRQTRDPYAVLVSEVMLQQTQVERVVSRYLAWLERWPTAQALAAAPRAEVIREWQGLGYNRRAVNLHRAAEQIAEHGWPDDLTELPGVGRYTADAVAAFACGAPVLPEDTNVRRVQERTGYRFAPECAQALMDLGATVCLARVPRCGVCPLASAKAGTVRRLVPAAAGPRPADGRRPAAEGRRARRRGRGGARARRARHRQQRPRVSPLIPR